MGNRRTLIKCGYFTSVLPGEAVWEPGTVKHNQKKEGPEMPWAERAAGFHSGPEARKFPPARSFRENRKQNGGGNFETGGPEEIRTLDLSDAKRFIKLFWLVFAPFSHFCWSSLHLQASLTRCFPCVPATSVVGSVVRNASRL